MTIVSSIVGVLMLVHGCFVALILGHTSAGIQFFLGGVALCTLHLHKESTASLMKTLRGALFALCLFVVVSVMVVAIQNLSLIEIPLAISLLASALSAIVIQRQVRVICLTVSVASLIPAAWLVFVEWFIVYHF